METELTSGAFIPLWILGAGLLLGVIGWFRTPNDTHRRRESYPGPNAGVHPGTLPPRSMPMGQPLTGESTPGMHRPTPLR